MGLEASAAGTERIAAALNAAALTKGWAMRCDGALAFEHAQLGALLRLWQSKAADGPPPRSAFDMRSLKPFAPNVVILEREGGGAARRYRFRLFGSALSILFGEHTGRTLNDTVSPELLPSWHAVYDAVLELRGALRIVTHYRTPSDNYLKGEIFAAAMTDDAGEPRMVLAATYVGMRDTVPSPFG